MKSIEEIAGDARVFNIIYKTNICLMALVKLKDCKTCSLIVGTNEHGLEHVSVAPRHRFVLPSWEDMAELKELCFADNEEVYQIHPPKDRYVNIKENCLHLWRPCNGRTLNDLTEEGKE